ncbi:MAG: ChbG/HpnK family deacetylase [Patescibacteria group bacterium]
MAMRFEYEFSFIFPIHNEEAILKKQISTFINFLKKRKIRNYEIILIENGSIDNSFSIIANLSKIYKEIKFYHLSKTSYGLAIKNGLLLAKGKYLLLLDIDFFNLNFLKEGLKEITKYQLVVASKSLIKGSDQRPFSHRLRTKVFQLITKHIFKYSGTDTHGNKIIQNSLLLKKIIYSSFTKYEFFDTELLLRMMKTKTFKLKEIGIITGEIRLSRYSSIRRYYLCLLDFIRIVSSLVFRDKNFGKQTINSFKINADDYGLNNNTDGIILAQAQASSVVRISILANLVSNESLKSLSLLSKKTNLDLNLHFNLLRGKPISPIINIPSLVDKNGQFFSLSKFLIRMLFSKINMQEVELELSQQFNYLKKHKIECVGLDSEQHLHIFYPIWPSIENFAKSNNLKIRSQKSSFYHLKKHPIKYLFTYFAQLFFSFVLFEKRNKVMVKTHDAIIVHPGSNYD